MNCFKLFTEGIHVPPGSTYTAIEATLSRVRLGSMPALAGIDNII